VRRDHFERLRPVCPACRALNREAPVLTLGTVARAEGDDILEGVLLCPERICQCEHPIIDGIPILVGNIESWFSHQMDAVLRRQDLSAFMESLIGDAAGPGVPFDRDRMNLSLYGRSHWGDFDSQRPIAHEGNYAALVEAGLVMLDGPPRGVWADIGCSVGRGTHELARRTGELAVGVDLSFSMLRVAERVRREGVAVFPLRRVGLVHDRCDLPIAGVPGDRMSFWCADVSALPFPDGTFDGALSLNIVDTVAAPLGHLMELGRTLRPGAHALLTTPWDWSGGATLLPHWIGGHSQRGPSHGSSKAELRRILSADRAAGIDTGLIVVDERDPVQWRLYSNERSILEYSVELLLLERRI
jgi:SAM-dependent methyltransferase/uncharacterized protein YbaR (Trm112 family)